MPKLIMALVAMFIICTAAPIASAADIVKSYGTFIDGNRDNRQVPYKLYMPANITAPAPVVIFSHGLGGSVEAAPYLGEALAQNGYVSFFIQHPGSDKSLWEGTKNPLKIKRKLASSIRKPGAAIDRYGDLPFVIDELEKLNKTEGALKGKMDLARIGMAGHSYGARSVMIAAGEKMPLVGNKFKEPRIKAAIALSPNIPERQLKKSDGNIPDIYNAVDIPLFHITGTEDGHPFTKDFDPITRTLPYQGIDTRNQYLLVLDGANHATFGGGRKAQKSDPRYQQNVAEGATLFFDAYLKGDNRAKSTLKSEYRASLSQTDRFEFK